MSGISYTPVPSLLPFLLSEAFQSFVVGPIGSCKTTASLMKIVMEARKMAPCKDGIRRSRCAVVRNTRQMLLDSTIKDFLTLFPEGEAGAYLRTELKFVLRFDDVECEVLFRGLDDSNDVRRLLSLQLSFAMMDEVREINPDVFDALTGRLGRYPNGLMVPHRPEWGVDSKGNPIQGCVDDNGRTMKKIWGATNPADADTFWEKYLSNPTSAMSVTIQPSGRSEEADWLQHLPSNYYEDLMIGKTDEWISVYVDGKWGASLQGQPVFKCFNKDTHVAAAPLKMNGASVNPLLIGFDCTGLNPACVIGQVGFSGKLHIFESLYSLDMGPLRFVREVLKPTLTNKYSGIPIAVIIDPAGMNRESNERSVKDMLVAEGFNVRPAKTNNISARISAVEQFLTRLVDGEPAFLVNATEKTLIEALRSKYKYKLNQKGERDEKPDKNHPWADVVDALQYLCLHADGGAIFGSTMDRDERREVERVSCVGWT